MEMCFTAPTVPPAAQHQAKCGGKGRAGFGEDFTQGYKMDEPDGQLSLALKRLQWESL